MKKTMYELLGMIKDGKASDITTNFMFDRKKYNLLAFLDEYTLDINSLNWVIEILEEPEEQNKTPEKITTFFDDTLEEFTAETRINGDRIKEHFRDQFVIMIIYKINEIIDYLEYLESKGE